MSENNQKNILYILGAGASAGALPVVRGMEERMKVWTILKIKKQIEKEASSSSDISNKYSEIALDFNENIRQIKNIEKRRSFDTYLKELYLQNDDEKQKFLKGMLKDYLSTEQEYNILHYISDENKNIQQSEDIGKINKANIMELFNSDINIKKNIKWDAGYLNIEWMIGKIISFHKNFVKKTNIDQRYINFLVDIMGDPTSLKKIKIYSWNYDTQLDLAIEELKLENVDRKKEDGQLEILKNMEVKINGSIKDDEIKFAWEHGNDFTFLKFEENEEWFRNVSDIVIIGYSFPFSNRRTDLRILSSIIRSFQKQYNIYIQTLDEESFNNIKESIGSLVNEITYTWSGGYNWEDYVKIIPKYDKTSFFIPPHY